MADKFKDYETPICSDWLNTVDDAVFDALLEPKTPDEARTNIGAVNGEEVVIIGDAHYSQLGHNHDHGQLDGLADDDHTQYHNDTRGDARYSQLGHDLCKEERCLGARNNWGRWRNRPRRFNRSR